VLKPLPLIQGSIRRPLFYLYTNPDKPLGPATQILIDLIKSSDAQSQPVDGRLAQASTLNRTTP